MALTNVDLESVQFRNALFNIVYSFDFSSEKFKQNKNVCRAMEGSSPNKVSLGRSNRLESV